MRDNWSLLVTHAGSPGTQDRRAEEKMESRLETLKTKWEKRHPDLEVSIVNREGDRIYMGRYFEGVVVRLKGPNGPVTFLTTEMARQFGKWLVGDQAQ